MMYKDANIEHELNLLENAIDSLKEALLKYKEASSDNLSSYKFAILHFSHFFELLFKHYVTLSHPLLIYRNPFSKRIGKENTIGLWDAVQFLKNEGKEISPDFNNDLEWIKKLRNDIEHYKFKFNAIEARNTLGRLIRATNEFNDKYKVIDIASCLHGSNLQIYTELGDEYKSKLSTAQFTAKANATDEQVYDCTWCGEKNVMSRDGIELQCHFCTYEDEIVCCCNCSEEIPMSEASVWNDDHPNSTDYICDNCSDYILSK